MPLFTDSELKQAICLKVVKPPRDNPDGVHLEFHGRITVRAMEDLKLDHVDRQVIASPVRNAADMLQSLEILFRRWAERYGDDRWGIPVTTNKVDTPD